VSVNWGSVPDWLAGGGAVVALLWARKAAQAASRTDQRQGEQLAALERDKTRQQAEKFAVWLDYVPRESEANQPRSWSWYFKVRNASELPVYDLNVWANLIDDDGQKFTPCRWFQAVPPGARIINLHAFDGSLSRTFYGRANQHVELIFRDANGTAWRRRRSHLEQLSDDIFRSLAAEAQRMRRRRAERPEADEIL
jgi:hypothetical protein